MRRKLQNKKLQERRRKRWNRREEKRRGQETKRNKQGRRKTLNIRQKISYKRTTDKQTGPLIIGTFAKPFISDDNRLKSVLLPLLQGGKG